MEKKTLTDEEKTKRLRMQARASARKRKREGMLTTKQYPETRLARQRKYRQKYPEKFGAFVPLKGRPHFFEGSEFHHWSYLKENHGDVLELTREHHRKLHRYLLYDQPYCCYRRIDTMELLDTREKNEIYADYIGSRSAEELSVLDRIII